MLEDTFHVPFVFAPEVLSAADLVAVGNVRTSRADAYAILVQVLDSRGFQMTKTGSIHYVARSPGAPVAAVDGTTRITYTPLHRDTRFFAKALPPIFPDALFSFDKPGKQEDAHADFFFAQVKE